MTNKPAIEVCSYLKSYGVDVPLEIIEAHLFNAYQFCFTFKQAKEHVIKIFLHDINEINIMTTYIKKPVKGIGEKSIQNIHTPIRVEKEKFDSNLLPLLNQLNITYSDIVKISDIKKLSKIKRISLMGRITKLKKPGLLGYGLINGYIHDNYNSIYFEASNDLIKILNINSIYIFNNVNIGILHHHSSKKIYFLIIDSNSKAIEFVYNKSNI